MNLLKDKKVVIKPHPKESKNYSEFFSDLEVLNSSFPIELLELIGFTPKIVCSVSSTALFNFKHSELYVYEGETSSEYLNGVRKIVRDKLNNS